MSLCQFRLSLACVALFGLLTVPAHARQFKKPTKTSDAPAMSAMGIAAARARAFINGDKIGDEDVCINAPDCQDDQSGPAGGQAETSLAVDATGQHIVVGVNDTRGFNLNPVSVSGFMYSDDGGKTWVDGGQLPVTTGTNSIGTTVYPQVYGDPDVKYLGACNFIYTSILMKAGSVPGTSSLKAFQTMAVHRSNDCGHTWTGPFEVTPATNPNGLFSSTSFSPRDAADKEFIDVDPETGRVILSWSNFTPAAAGGVEISTTYSDNIMTGNPPTWSQRVIVGATSEDGQGSYPVFAGQGSANAYMAWVRFPFPGVYLGFGNNVGFARSTDNGQTWSEAASLVPEFFTMDYVLGNDRVNTSPALAVDKSGGPHSGNLYLVYANNDSGDGADIMFQRSVDQGLTFSQPLALNSRPGNDRAQWFPSIAVDSATGRIWVYYYDQGAATSGDLTQVSFTFSDDGGISWKQPASFNNQPFKAGWGNDTGQPNLGDYNKPTAQGGELFAPYAITSQALFSDTRATGSFNVPDTVVSRVAEADHTFKATTLDIIGGDLVESGGNGNIDPGDTLTISTLLRNYVTNPLNAEKVRGATATLTSSTPGVNVLQGFSPVPNLDPGQSGMTKTPFVVKILPDFVPGTNIDFILTVRSAEHGAVTLVRTIATGTPQETVLLAEDFDSVSAGALPAGWSAAHGAGQNTVPWTTNNTFCGAKSNGAYHINANDNSPGKVPTRWERLVGPIFNVPADSSYVTVEFDTCYDTEDDPNFNVLAYDGFFLRVTDWLNNVGRSMLAEAFEEEFTTGNLQGYPKHQPRNSSSNYFPNGDMAMWAGDSHGWQHVRFKFLGMQGSPAQLRFEYAQDSGGICSDVRPGHDCGVIIDNVVVKSIKAVAP